MMIMIMIIMIIIMIIIVTMLGYLLNIPHVFPREEFKTRGKWGSTEFPYTWLYDPPPPPPPPHT